MLRILKRAARKQLVELAKAPCYSRESERACLLVQMNNNSKNRLVQTEKAMLVLSPFRFK